MTFVNGLAGDAGSRGAMVDIIVLGVTGADVFYSAARQLTRILDFPDRRSTRSKLSASVTVFADSGRCVRRTSQIVNGRIISLLFLNGDNGLFFLANLSIADLSESDFSFTTARAHKVPMVAKSESRHLCLSRMICWHRIIGS